VKHLFLRGVLCLTAGTAAAYIVLRALTVFLDGGSTAVLCTASVRETVPVYGVFLREEHLLTGTHFILAPEGGRVAAGTALAADLTSPAAGIFTAHLDGWEHLAAPALTVEGVRTLCDDRRLPLSSPGKLVTDAAYRFYALLRADDAERLRVGETYALECAYWGGVPLTLAEKGETAQEFTPVLFTGDRAMDTVLYLRRVSGQLLLGTYTGLRVPHQAVRTDGGAAYVETLLPGGSARTEVQLLYAGADFDLIASALLGPGSEVILN